MFVGLQLTLQCWSMLCRLLHSRMLHIMYACSNARRHTWYGCLKVIGCSFLSHQVKWRATRMTSNMHPPQRETSHIKCSFYFYTAKVVCMFHECCCSHSKHVHMSRVVWYVCWYICRTAALQSGLPEFAVRWIWRWSIWHWWLLGNKSRRNKNLALAPQYCYLYYGSMDHVIWGPILGRTVELQ